MQGLMACGIAPSKQSLGRQGTEPLLTLRAVFFDDASAAATHHAAKALAAPPVQTKLHS